MTPRDAMPPGTAQIKAWLVANDDTLSAARAGELPSAPFYIDLRGDVFELDDIAGIIEGFENRIGEIGLRCLREHRDLWIDEAAALDLADAFVSYVAQGVGAQSWPEEPLVLAERLELFHLLSR